MYLQLAWRNVWRNPRRTIVILVAVIIGVWSMILLGALMRGIAVGIVENGIITLTGHVQIHHKGYRIDPSIENSMTDSRVVEKALLEKLRPGANWVRRVRVNAIANNARHSNGVTLVGIEPLAEAHDRRRVVRSRHEIHNAVVDILIALEQGLYVCIHRETESI